MFLECLCLFLFSPFVLEVLTSQNFGRDVNGVAFHPTKSILASCSNDRSIKLWNTDTGTELSTLRGHRYVLCPVFPDDV